MNATKIVVHEINREHVFVVVKYGFEILKSMKLLKLVILLTLTWLLCVGQSPNPTATQSNRPPEIGNQTPTSNKQEAKPPVVVAEPSNPASRVQKKSKDESQPPARIHGTLIIVTHPDRVIRRSTIVLAIVAVLQTILLLYTLKATRLNTDTLIRMNSAHVRLIYVRIKRATEPIIEYRLQNFGGGHAFLEGYSYGSEMSAGELTKNPSDAPFHKAITVTIAPRTGFRGSSLN
jgi:hypothetical protein